MTYLVHDPATFASRSAAAFAACHADSVQRVNGGVIRTTRAADDKVALVIGGGSGHYPAFAGLVGPGLADGAVLGNIFASPSANQVESVARAVEQGRGVLLSYGNYAGDTLQFDAAAERLAASGIEVQTVRVTDDISSAPFTEREKRRGIAGDLCVFKVAGAATAAGFDLAEVTRLAARANERTRSLGVAFTGCTLPGADAPLFEVPPGRMAIGLGIHGEPGLDETDVPTPDALARLLVERLLAEAPSEDGPARVAVIVNGLGAFKSDEMFVLYGEIRRELEEAHVVVADSLVGEFCTSFEMAGVSLTLLWLDDELEPLWRASAAAPAFHRGEPDHDRIALIPGDTAHFDDLPEASQASQALSTRLVDTLARLSATIDEHAAELGRIDAVAGDGDHGIGMTNGAHAALAEARAVAERGAGAGTLLTRAGHAWQDGAGGTSGALWGLMLRTIGERLGDTDPASDEIWRDAVRRAIDALVASGGAKVGDKTMVDAALPFADELTREPQRPLTNAWAAAATAAQRGAEATADMLPGLGRARSHGDKALGVQDPGAVSFALIAHAVAPH